MVTQVWGSEGKKDELLGGVGVGGKREIREKESFRGERRGPVMRLRLEEKKKRGEGRKEGIKQSPSPSHLLPLLLLVTLGHV